MKERITPIRIVLGPIRNVEEMEILCKDNNLNIKPSFLFKWKEDYHEVWLDPNTHEIMCYKQKGQSILFVSDSYEKNFQEIPPIKVKKNKKPPINFSKLSKESMENKLNEILDKITQYGKSFLNDSERKFLEDFSNKN